MHPGKAGYSGWDLAVNRERPAGFPDALLVATPPYNSINEHEVGTTFGLRAQDAIGWNPRSFHFITYPARHSPRASGYSRFSAAPAILPRRPAAASQAGTATQRQLRINQKSSSGQFRILDARIAPGVSDAASYAEPWALASPRTKHSIEPSSTGKSTDLGELHWMQFSITLWLPANWKLPDGVAGKPIFLFRVIPKVIPREMPETRSAGQGNRMRPRSLQGVSSCPGALRSCSNGCPAHTAACPKPINGGLAFRSRAVQCKRLLISKLWRIDRAGNSACQSSTPGSLEAFKTATEATSLAP